jgi:hypothetical protein
MRTDNASDVTFSAPEISPRRRTPLTPPARPVCAMNLISGHASYHQHILSSAKLRKIRYSLPELYVKSVYLNLFGGKGMKSMKQLGGREL